MRLTHDPAHDWNPAWSSDGSRIAFESDRDGEVGIYVVNADGTDVHRLVDIGAQACCPAWRPSLDAEVGATPPPTYLSADERWAPPVYAEGDRLVMPVTFPEGTTAELVYPPELALEELNVYPDTYGEGGPNQCGWAFTFPSPPPTPPEPPERYQDAPITFGRFMWGGREGSSCSPRNTLLAASTEGS